MRGAEQGMISSMIRWISCWLGFMFFTIPLLAENQGQDAGSLYLEARKLAMGEGCQIDMIRARELYRKAADLGDPRALAWKARNIYGGVHGFSKDEAEARRIFQKIEPRLREMGSKKEEDALGSLCRTLATIDPKSRGREVFKLAREVAEDGKPSDLAALGWFYQSGVGIARDEKEAVKWYTKSAEQGDVTGQRLLGWCYANGSGVAKDEKEAVKWYTKSAEHGDAKGQRLLGWSYANGAGVAKNEKEAVKWYTKSAEQGEATGQRLLGWCYANGAGVPKDEREAVKWYGKAAEKGDGWSQNKLGYCYANGIGVEKDYKKAFEWYRKAADKENSEALGSVGWCYETGNGIGKNDNEALKWYTKAAKKQNSWAQKRLMVMGGVAFWEKNYSLAVKCFQAAESFGVKGAGEELYRLDVQMRKTWEGADPRRGILAKRKNIKGQENENSETARLAGELLSFGYPIESKMMVQEAIENSRWSTSDEELAGWYTLAGFCEMADPQLDSEPLISEKPKGWPEWLRPKFAQVGLGMLNLRIASPQQGLDVSFVSDFISPSEPRRWASLFMAQSEWGLKLWLEKSTGWHSRLARAAVASTGKGIDYMWATQNLKNLGKAKSNFEKATKLFPNLSAWAGLAMIARQEGDASGQEKAIEEMRNILTENAIRDAANVSKTVNGKAEKKNPEDLAKAIAIKAKLHMNKMFEGLAKDGELPWGNEKGELSFGFGYGGGPGFFHGGLLATGAKLFIPLLLYVKPDWLMLIYDLSMQSGTLSPYQLGPLYEALTERPSTRMRAISRLVQIHRYLEDKEETLRWALCAAEANPQDLQTLQTAAWVAKWAGESDKADAISKRIAKEEVRAQLTQDEYLSIYQMINEADRHFQAKELKIARHLYENSLERLREIEKKNPDWEPLIIRYRIKYLEEKLSENDLKGEKQ